MASNFFKRWSSRSLTGTDNTTKLSDTKEIVTEPIEIEPLVEQAHASNTNQYQPITENNIADDVVDSGVDESVNMTADSHCDEALTIADADSVTFDSGVASFLQHGVDKSVKKAALAKLFHADEFNYISDMDDHTEDFSNIPKLDDSIVKQLRGWVNKVVEDPELVEDTDIESVEEAKVELTTEPEVSAVDDEIAEPVMEDLDSSPSVDESNNNEDPQGETLRD